MTEFKPRLVQNHPKQPVDGGGEPPYHDDMETRISSIETKISDMDSRFIRVETTMSHVDREVSQFKWWLAGSAVAIILAVVGSVLGTGIAIQQMTVSTFQAATPQTIQQATPPPVIINIPPPAQAPAK